MKKIKNSNALVSEKRFHVHSQGRGSMQEEWKIIHLKRAKLCVQCEMIFNGRAEVCPVCSSPSWMPLEKWLNNRHVVAKNITAAGEPEGKDDFNDLSPPQRA